MLPAAVEAVLRRLEGAGYGAYLVGGCVRDVVMGRKPHDYDITTSALPEVVMALFDGFSVPTGLRHGTVTVRCGGGSFEVTTFRTESGYGDHRHPDAVSFTRDLTADLARRDFTVNAMAMDLRGQLSDPFGGQADIRRRLLRCVGEPAQRFSEDALRILRGLRFSAVLGFAMEPQTDAALRRMGGDLRLVAAERVREELTRLLCGGGAGDVLVQYPQVLGAVLPEILPCVGFDQRNFHHIYDVWAHTARAVDAAPAQPVLRWTMLLHDLGKPECFTADEAGVGHFYGHSIRSAEIAEDICRRLRFDTASARQICTLVSAHDRDIRRTPKAIRRALAQLGEETLRQLCDVMRADTLAQAACCRPRLAAIEEAQAIIDAVTAEDACFSLRQLAVNGRDMLALGYCGAAVGDVLHQLLDAVLDGAAPNQRQALLSLAERLRR